MRKAYLYILVSEYRTDGTFHPAFPSVNVKQTTKSDIGFGFTCFQERLKWGSGVLGPVIIRTKALFFPNSERESLKWRYEELSHHFS